jgi:hypothetical protein
VNQYIQTHSLAHTHTTHTHKQDWQFLPADMQMQLLIMAEASGMGAALGMPGIHSQKYSL